MFSSSASRRRLSSAVSRTIAGMVSRLVFVWRANAAPHHQLVVAVVDHTHHDRLHHAELTDRMNQFGQRFLIEHLAGLLGIRLDGGYWDLAVDRTDIGRWRGRWRCRRRATSDDYIGGGGTKLGPAGADEPSTGAVGMSDARPRPSPPLRRDDAD